VLSHASHCQVLSGVTTCAGMLGDCGLGWGPLQVWSKLQQLHLRWEWSSSCTGAAWKTRGSTELVVTRDSKKIKVKRRWRVA